MKHIRTTIKCLMERARAYQDAQAISHGNREIPDLKEFHDTVKSLKVADHHFTSTNMLKLHNRADWTGTTAIMRNFTADLVEALRKRNFPMYVHTAYRSPELQRTLQRKGLSKLQSGPHQRGCAVDIVHAYHHWEIPLDAWKYVGIIGSEIINRQKLPIRWGGDWDSDGIPVIEDRTETFWDPAHWEMIEWRKHKEVLPHDHKLRYPPRGLKKGHYESTSTTIQKVIDALR